MFPALGTAAPPWAILPSTGTSNVEGNRAKSSKYFQLGEIATNTSNPFFKLPSKHIQVCLAYPLFSQPQAFCRDMFGFLEKPIKHFKLGTKLLRGCPVKNPKTGFNDFNFTNSRGENNNKKKFPSSVLKKESVIFSFKENKILYIDFLGLELSLSPQDSAACLDWSLDLIFFSSALLHYTCINRGTG